MRGKKRKQREEEEGCRTLKLVFPFTAQPIIMKTQSICRLKTLVNVTKFWGKEMGKKRKKKEPGFNVFLFNKANV